MTNTWYCNECNDIQTGPKWELNNLGIPISDQLADPRCKCGEIMVPRKSASDEDIEPDVIELTAPPKSTISDLAYWYGRAKVFWPDYEIIITTVAAQSAE